MKKDPPDPNLPPRVVSPDPKGGVVNVTVPTIPPRKGGWPLFPTDTRVPWKN